MNAELNQQLRRDLLQLASTVLSAESSELEKRFAASMLADLVRKSIPAPRPVSAPNPNLVDDESMTGGERVS